jgi:hypothetical protein
MARPPATVSLANVGAALAAFPALPAAVAPAPPAPAPPILDDAAAAALAGDAAVLARMRRALLATPSDYVCVEGVG